MNMSRVTALRSAPIVQESPTHMSVQVGHGSTRHITLSEQGDAQYSTDQVANGTKVVDGTVDCKVEEAPP